METMKKLKTYKSSVRSEYMIFKNEWLDELLEMEDMEFSWKVFNAIAAAHFKKTLPTDEKILKEFNRIIEL